MNWRNILFASGVMFGIGNGFAQDPQTGQVYPMVDNNLAIRNDGQVEYVVPRSGSTGFPHDGRTSSEQDE